MKDFLLNYPVLAALCMTAIAALILGGPWLLFRQLSRERDALTSERLNRNGEPQ